MNPASAPAEEPEAGTATVEEIARATPETPAPTTPKAPGAEEAEASAGEDLLSDPEALESLTEEQIRGIKDAALRKLIRRNKQLTARFRSAESELNQLRGPGRAQEESTDAHSPTPELKAIHQRLGVIEHAVRWASENPDGGEYVGPDGKTLKFTADQAANLVAQGGREIARLEARREVQIEDLRRQDQQVRAESTREAMEAFPWFKDPASDEYALANEILTNAPYLRNHPQWQLWLGDAVEGRKARLARAGTGAAKPAVAPRPQPPRVAPPVGSTAPRQDPLDRQIAEAEARFKETGRQNDLIRLESLKRQRARRK